jgi:hypothetical protein
MTTKPPVTLNASLTGEPVFALWIGSANAGGIAFTAEQIPDLRAALNKAEAFAVARRETEREEPA